MDEPYTIKEDDHRADIKDLSRRAFRYLEQGQS